MTYVPFKQRDNKKQKQGNYIPLEQRNNKQDVSGSPRQSFGAATRVFGKRYTPQKRDLDNFEFAFDENTNNNQVDSRSSISTEPLPSNVSDRDKAPTDFIKGVAQGSARGFGGAISDADRIFGGEGVISSGLESSLDTEIGKMVFGEDTEQLSLESSGRELRFADPNEESEGFMKILDPIIGAAGVALDVSGFGGAADDVARYTLKAGDDVLDSVIGSVRGNADRIAKTADRSEVENILRGDGLDIADDDIAKLAEKLVNANSREDILAEAGRFAGYTKADNLAHGAKSSSPQAFEDISKASSKDEVRSILLRDDNNVDRLFSKSVSDDIESQLVRAKNADEVQEILRDGAVRSIKDRGFVETTREAVPDATKIGGQYIPRSTDNLVQKAQDIIDNNVDEAMRIAKEESDDRAVAVASQLMKHFSRKADEATTEVTRNANLDKVADIANEIAPKLTEQGRAIQAASIMGKMSPEGQLRAVQKQIRKFNEDVPLGSKRKELSSEEIGEILDEAKAIQNMEEGVERAMRWQQLQNRINRMTPSSWMERITQVWKAGLLTGFDTHALNLLSTAGHSLTETAKDVPAVLLDKMISNITGKRTKGLAGISTQGFKEGASKGWRYLKTGFDERDIAKKLDYRKVSFGEGKVGKMFEKSTDFVFRLLGTGDQPFYYGALQRSLRDQAIAKSSNKGLKGDEAKKFVENLLENPTEDMIATAGNDAVTAVFQNKTMLGESGRKIQEIGEGAGQFAVPFSTTPSAVAMQILNYSPAGAAKAVFDNYKTFNQREFVEAIGRSLTGTGALALGAMMYKDDNISLGYPQGDERQQELDAAESVEYNSIKIGDTWHDSVAFGPVGSLLTVGGYYQKALDDGGSPSKAMIDAIGGGYQSLLQHSFLEGLDSAVGVLTDPERNLTSWIARTAGSFVPSIFSDIGAVTDTKDRDVRAEDFWGQVYENVIKRIPEARENLEPRVDALGNESETGGVFNEALAPTRPQKSTATAVTKELRRLMESGYRVAPTKLGTRDGYSSLPDDVNTQLWKDTGRIMRGKLSQLMKTDKYQQATDEQKAEIVDDFINKSKTIGRATITVQETEGLQGEELRERLKEMREDGFLTKQVFDVYKRIR